MNSVKKMASNDVEPHEASTDKNVIHDSTGHTEKSTRASIITSNGDGLEFKGLKVEVSNNGAILDSKLLFRAYNGFKRMSGIGFEPRVTYSPVKGICGHVSRGELLIVIGPSGSGRTAFLRAISGTLGSHCRISGMLTFDGKRIGNRAFLRRMTSFISSTDDHHCPELTVGETLEFAASVSGSGGHKENSLRVDEMMESLGLLEARNTQIGDEDSRGISGGQKRRVSIAEGLLNDFARIHCFDELTEGLDSLTSYEVVKVIRDRCSTTKQCGAVISLQSPDDKTLELADNILVLNDIGGMIYFGPPGKPAHDHFDIIQENQDNNSFVSCALRKCTGSEGQILSDKFLKVPHLHAQVEKGSVDEFTCCSDDRQSSQTTPPKYIASRASQYSALTWRQWYLVTRNPITYVRVLISVVFGIIIGALFSGVNDDFLGALGTTGFFFLTFSLSMMLSAAVVLPTNFRYRANVGKQVAARMYSPIVWYLTKMLFDLPLCALEGFILASIPYYWIPSTLQNTSTYLYFACSLVGIELFGNALGMLLSYMSRTEVIANIFVSVIALGFGTLACWLPPYSQIPPWLSWMSWLNPTAYALEGILLQTYENKNLTGIVLEANGTKYPIIENLPGDLYLTTVANFPRLQWASDETIVAANIGILFGLTLAAHICAFVMTSLTIKRQYFKVRNVYNHLTSGSTFNDEPLEYEQEVCQRTGTNTLQLKNVSYFVKESLRKEVQLVQGATASMTSGHMMALIGKSGAGKSTLMDVLAGVKSRGRITGEITLNGHKVPTSKWRRLCAYAEQDDIFNPFFTVYETVAFTSKCSNPMSTNENNDFVLSLLSLVQLRGEANVFVGSKKRADGLKKSHRRLLTVAVALAQKPALLFCDEPTTSIGQNEAAKVLDVLHEATRRLNLITMVTVHQPGNLFNRFDDVMVVEEGGRVGYSGPIGINGETVLRRLKYTGPISANLDVAECLLEIVNEKKEFEVAVEASDKLDDSSNEAKLPLDDMIPKRASPLVRFAALLERQWLYEWRNVRYSWTRSLVSVFVAVVLGCIFLNKISDGSVWAAIFSVVGVFFVTFVLVIPMQASAVHIIEDRAVMYRETSAGLYARISYAVSLSITGIPFNLLNASILLIFFALAGFDTSSSNGGYLLLMLFLLNWMVVSLGQLFTFVCPNEETANGLAGFSMILSAFLAGFLILSRLMPDLFHALYDVNAFRYGIQGMVTNQMAGERFPVVPLLLSLLGIDTTTLNAFDSSQTGLLSSLNTTSMSNALVSMVDNSGLVDNSVGSAIPGLDEILALVACTTVNNCLNESGVFQIVKCMIDNCEEDVAAVIIIFEDELDCVIHDATSSSGNFLEDLVWCTLNQFLQPEVVALLPCGEHSVTLLLDQFLGGISGSLVLWIFGWADIDCPDIDVNIAYTTYEWSRCVPIIAGFVIGIEILRLIAVKLFVWTKK